MKTIFDELQQEVKNWWISLILGILYVIVAISQCGPMPAQDGKKAQSTPVL